MSARALVVGARGQIGRGLVPTLLQAGWQVQATTRGSAPAGSSTPVHWHRVDLFAPPVSMPEVDCVFGLGPLDGLAQWLPRSGLRPRRVIAFGSTSAVSKRDSPDAGERALADRLATAQAALQRWAEASGADLTVLRPTLIYGVGLDRNLSRLAQLARRWRVLPLPRSATGLRQPVHAADLAAVAFAAAQRARLPQPTYDLPGGETLSYREMVARVLACLQPPPRLLLLPDLVVRGGLGLARVGGRLRDAGPALLARMHEDLVFDPAPAQRDLQFAARAFAPEPAMFVSPETSSAGA